MAKPLPADAVARLREIAESTDLLGARHRSAGTISGSAFGRLMGLDAAFLRDLADTIDTKPGDDAVASYLAEHPTSAFTHPVAWKAGDPGRHPLSGQRVLPCAVCGRDITGHMNAIAADYDAGLGLVPIYFHDSCVRAAAERSEARCKST